MRARSRCRCAGRALRLRRERASAREGALTRAASARAPRLARLRLAGVKESDTGLALPSQWDLTADKQMMQEEQPLQVRAVAPSAPGSARGGHRSSR